MVIPPHPPHTMVMAIPVMVTPDTEPLVIIKRNKKTAVELFFYWEKYIFKGNLYKKEKYIINHYL
jgi:hypothetical protein